jgi:hypothetical protein
MNNYKSAKIILTCLVFFLWASYYLHSIPLQGPNVDLGHHLLFGRIIIETGKIINTNLVSFTYPDYHFVNSQWLSQVVLYLCQRSFGFTGLIFLSVFLITSAFALVFWPAAKSDFASAITVSLVYLQLIIDRTEIKPELFSWLFLAIFIFILYRFRHKYTPLIYTLIPLQALWINFHIYYFVGNVLLLIFFVDTSLRERSIKSPKTISLLLVNLFSGLILLVNPSLLRGAAYPLYVLSDYGFKVIENYSLFKAFSGYRDMTFLYFGFSVVVLWSGIIYYHKKIPLADFLLSVFFTFMAFFAVRNFPLYMFGTFIPIVRICSFTFKGFNPKHNIIAIFFVILLIIPAVRWNYSVHGFGLGVIDAALASVNFIRANNLSGPIYNNYNIGNYLEYKIFPWGKVFVDGNPEEYPKQFFENIYYPSEQSFAGFSRIAQKYHISVVYYDHVSQTQSANPLLTGLINSPNWKLVYLDNRIVIFVSNTSGHASLINKSTITESTFKLNPSDMSDPDQLRNLSNLFRVFGWYQRMYEADMKYLTFEPNNCVALRHVVAVMKFQKNPSLDTYASKYASVCSR